MTLPHALTDAYNEGRLLLFVGSGVSTSVHFRHRDEDVAGLTWAELVDYCAKDLGFDDASLLRVRGSDLQILEYFRQERGNDLGSLKTWFVGRMNPTDEELQKSPVLAQIARLDRLSLIYTTNFDAFIERALALAGRTVRPVVNEQDIQEHLKLQSTSPQCIRLVKFHGDMDHANDLVLTEQHYEKRLRLQDLLDQQLLADLVGRIVLFVGYSFSDWNVSYLFSLFNSLRGPGESYGKRAYITVSDPSRFEEKLFARRNIEILPISTFDKSASLARLLAQLPV